MQIQLYGNQIWLFRRPVDFRMSINGLSNLVMKETKRNPQEGIYLFYNRNQDKVKCLSWHKNGFALLYKQIERGRFCFNFNKATSAIEISAQEVGWLLAGLEWQKMRNWRELNYDKFS